MKKVLLFSALLWLLWTMPLHVSGTGVSIEESYSNEMDELLQSLPEDLKERYQEILSGDGGYEKVLDETDAGSLLETCMNALKEAFPSAIRLFVRLTAMLLCISLLGRIAYGLDSPSVIETFRLCAAFCFSLVLADTITGLLATCGQFLETIAGIASGSVSIVSAVTAASGNLTAAAVSRTSLMLVFALIQNFCSLCLVPVVRVSAVFGIVSAVSQMVRLDSISRCIRRVSTITLSFIMTLCGFVIGVQTILAKSADTFSLRTVKFALGNAVPLVGTALAEAMTTVTGSLSLVRSAAGGLAVFAVLVLLLPVVIQLLLYRLVLSVCQGIAEMTGSEKEALLLLEIHGTFGFLLAVVSLSAILLIFVLALFALLGGSA